MKQINNVTRELNSLYLDMNFAVTISDPLFGQLDTYFNQNIPTAPWAQRASLHKDL